MDKQKVGLLVQVSGILLGIIVTITMVKLYPIKIALLCLGAGFYFVGQYLKRS